MRYNQNRARKSSERAQLWIFKLEHYTPSPSLKRRVFLEFLVENKVFHFSKGAFCAGTARKKWLKEALLDKKKNETIGLDLTFLTQETTGINNDKNNNKCCNTNNTKNATQDQI